MTEENSEVQILESYVEETQDATHCDIEEPVEQYNREEPAEQEVAKRGRGRPKGALGKKTKQEQERKNVVEESLDVSSEPKPKPIRKPRAKKIKEEEPLSPIDERPVPKPKRRVVMKKQSEAPPKIQEEPMTYLEVLTRGLRAAEYQHKARKVAAYDNFFRY